MDPTVRVATSQEWDRARRLRLEMLADSPAAFGRTLADAQRLTDEQWRASAARMDDDGTRHVVAVADDGSWLGQVIGKDFGPLGPEQWFSPGVVAVYVTPSARGAGLLEAMLDDVVGWLRDRGHTSCTLTVRDDNVRARRAYERYGFRPNGGSCPNRLDPAHRDVELELDLSERPS